MFLCNKLLQCGNKIFKTPALVQSCSNQNIIYLDDDDVTMMTKNNNNKFVE